MEFRINAHTYDAQKHPAIAKLKDGSFVVVWTGRAQGGAIQGIYGQRFSADGTKLGDEFEVSSDKDHIQAHPSVIENDIGFAVLWENKIRKQNVNNSSLETFSELGFQQFSPDGFKIDHSSLDEKISLLNSEVSTISCLATAQFNPSIDYSGLHKENIVLAYESPCYGRDHNIYNLYAAFISNGTSSTQVLHVDSTEIMNVKMHPVIASVDAHNAVIAWERHNGSPSRKDIYARKVNNTHDGTSNIIQVNNYTFGPQQNPCIAALDDKTLIIAWESYGQDGSKYGIYAQKLIINAAGDIEKEGEEFQVNSYTFGAQKNPHVASLPYGDFIISWDSRGQDGSVEGIYAQKFLKDTTRKDGEFRVSEETYNAQKNPVVVGLLNSKVAVAWSSRGQDGSAEGAYGRVIELNNSSSTTLTYSYSNTDLISSSVVLEETHTNTSALALSETQTTTTAIDTPTPVITTTETSVTEDEQLASNACNFIIINNSPHDLYTEEYIISHGMWVVPPPERIEAFSQGNFILNSSKFGLEQYHGSEGTVKYISEDLPRSIFKIYCNSPFNGDTSAFISNPYPQLYSTSFTCKSYSSPNHASETLNRCPTLNGDLSVNYYINPINNVITSPTLTQDRAGSTYIKISNDTPYPLRLLSAVDELGYWEEPLQVEIEPYSTSSWSVLGPDGSSGEVSRAKILYAFTKGRSHNIKLLKLEAYNPADTNADDTCRMNESSSNCSGIQINQVYILPPLEEGFAAYYECSSEGKIWTNNFCEQTSDLLYVNFHLVAGNVIDSI